jgi:hypothetical protein
VGCSCFCVVCVGLCGSQFRSLVMVDVNTLPLWVCPVNTTVANNGCTDQVLDFVSVYIPTTITTHTHRYTFLSISNFHMFQAEDDFGVSTNGQSEGFANPPYPVRFLLTSSFLLSLFLSAFHLRLQCFALQLLTRAMSLCKRALLPKQAETRGDFPLPCGLAPLPLLGRFLGH